MLFHELLASSADFFSIVDADARGFIALCIQITISLFGVLVVKWQLQSAKDVARAELLMRISETAQKKKFSEVVARIEQKQTPDQIQVREFLRFCESVTLMLENGIITCREIFPLTGYRMLLVLNSRWVRRAFLCPGGKGAVKFCAAFVLHEKLTQHFKQRFYRDNEMQKLYCINDHDLSSCREYMHLILRYHKNTRKLWSYCFVCASYQPKICCRLLRRHRLKTRRNVLRVAQKLDRERKKHLNVD